MWFDDTVIGPAMQIKKCVTIINDNTFNDLSKSFLKLSDWFKALNESACLHPIKKVNIELILIVVQTCVYTIVDIEIFAWLPDETDKPLDSLLTFMQQIDSAPYCYWVDEVKLDPMINKIWQKNLVFHNLWQVTFWSVRYISFQ